MYGLCATINTLKYFFNKIEVKPTLLDIYRNASFPKILKGFYLANPGNLTF